MLFFLFYWLYGNKKSRYNKIDNITLANIFLNTIFIEILVSATWFMEPYYGNYFDVIAFIAVTTITVKQLTQNGIFLLNENFDFIVLHVVLPLFLLWVVLRISYLYTTAFLIFTTWYKM